MNAKEICRFGSTKGIGLSQFIEEYLIPNWSGEAIDLGFAQAVEVSFSLSRTTLNNILAEFELEAEWESSIKEALASGEEYFGVCQGMDFDWFLIFEPPLH